MQNKEVGVYQNAIRKADVRGGILKYALPWIFAAFLVNSLFVDLGRGQAATSTLSFLNLLLFLACLLVATGLTRITGYALLLAGVFILYHSGAEPGLWMTAFRKTSSLITMIVMVPLLGLPMKYGGYLDALYYVYQKSIRSRMGLYMLSTAYSHVLCIILLIGSLPIVYQLQGGEQTNRYKNFIAPAMIRGFSSATLWSANFPAVALLLQITGVSWFKILPAGVILSVTLILMSFLWGKYVDVRETSGELLIESRLSKDEGGDPGRRVMEKAVRKKISVLIAIATAFMVTIYLTEWKLGIGLVTAVPITAIIFSLVWNVWLRGLSVSLFKELARYVAGLSKYKNEVIVFTGAGFFSTAVVAAGFVDQLTGLMQFMVGGNTWILTYVLMGLVLVLSTLGIHPLVVVTTLASTLEPALFNVSYDYLALVLICSFSMSLLFSPFANIVMITSDLFGMSSFELGIKKNGFFVLVVSTVLGLIMNLFSGRMI